MEVSMNHLKNYVLDRFEGAYAVLEDDMGKAFDVLREELPSDIREGDILHECGGAFVFDERATEEKRAKMKEIFQNLKRANSTQFED